MVSGLHTGLRAWLGQMEPHEQLVAALQLRGADLITREDLISILPFDLDLPDDE